MAHNPQLSAAAATLAVEAITPLLNSGFLKIYTGTQPATPETAITTQTLLATCTFGATAFGAAVAGVATANTITADSDCAASGTASWFRALTSASVAVFDGSCGATSSFDCVLSSVSIVQHATVAITSCVLTIVTS